MKRIITFAVALFIAVASLVTISCSHVTETGNPAQPTLPIQEPPPDQKPEDVPCEEAGGTWTEFPNGCADACGVTDDSICTQVLTMGCDCGEGMCWDGERCVSDGNDE